jgi:predicted Zn-dependent protease
MKVYPTNPPSRLKLLMALPRSLVSDTLVITSIVLAAALLSGCGGDRQPAGAIESGAIESETVEAVVDSSADIETVLESAKSLAEAGDHEQAAKDLYGLMIRYPDDDKVKLRVAQVEAARGKFEAALEIAESLGNDSVAFPAAVELRYQVLAKQGRYSQAADLLLDASQGRRDRTQWNHEAWRFLNHLGRRQEASQQAMQLCRQGLATEAELLSLIKRSAAFPTPAMIKNKEQGARQFADGLGKARWYFSVGEYQNAVTQLADQSRTGFQSVAAEAFYGRLLAESQDWEAFGRWHAGSSEEIKRHADYWSAIGTFFIDNLSHEAAARALLEAIRRDPTDRVCFQRLSKVLSALGRSDDGKQFQYRGVELAQTERLAEQLADSPNDRERRSQLARNLMELGRPFETLAWTSTLLPQSAIGPRQVINQQRKDLLSDPSVETMAVETALLEFDPTEFDLQPAMGQLFRDKRKLGRPATVASSKIAARPSLVNRAEEVGLKFQWYKDVGIDLKTIPIHESLGGGIAVLDYDLDGWPDLYLAQGSGDPPTDQCTRSSELFRNEASNFEPRTEVAHAEDRNYSSGLSSGDVNQDGFPDLFLGSLGHNRLLINNGDGTFREATSGLGAFPDRFTSSIAVADINGDQLPDLFESNYIEMEGGFALPQAQENGKLLAPSPLSHYPDHDRWFENLGDGSFRLHEIESSTANPGTSLGLVVTDFDSDGKNEVFVGIDVRPNHFLVQSGDNGFINLADAKGLANGFEGSPNGCMGIATGDFNRDGRFDMQIANYSLEPANYYLQTDSGDFTDNAVRYGLADVTRPYVGFGTKAVDVDRNGFLDFIVTNGHIFDLRDEGEPYQMAPQMLMSDGRGLELVEVDDPSGYWEQAYLGRSIALLDYDRDGATDFAIGHLDQPVALLHDETATDGRWVQFELVGVKSERDAIGAKLVVTAGQSQFTQWVTAGDGYFCSDEPVVSFSFPRSETPADVQLRVHWPSGLAQDFEAIEADNRYLVVEGEDVVTRR